MKNGCGTTSTACTTTGALADQASDNASARTESGEAPYTPLDINDPDGRFGNWMPGDDPDDWR